jgi:hypothetical protein
MKGLQPVSLLYLMEETFGRLELLGMCYILCMCVCVGASDTTTASDDPFGRFLLFLADFAIFS